METLRIYFADFWKSFDMQDNYFWNLLSERYRLILDPEQPEILFYSYLGLKDIRQKTFHRYKCIRIFYTGENLRPDYNECDFALSFDRSEDARNLRLPLYVLYNDYPQLLNRTVPNDLLKQKTKFCCFVVSNPENPVRNRFFHLLSTYKKVDSGGRFLNNIGGPVEDKIEFMKDYKFVISFENESYPGYVTEKVYEPKLVDSLPIYWGDPLISKEFNTNSFINCHDFSNMEEVVERVKELDQNDDLYLQYARTPFFLNDKPNEYVDKERVLGFLQKIIDQRASYRPLATTWKQYLYWYRDPIRYAKQYLKLFWNQFKGKGSTV
jgi:alpha(1,3/1,4) fucosyltransferase